MRITGFSVRKKGPKKPMVYVDVSISGLELQYEQYEQYVSKKFRGRILISGNQPDFAIQSYRPETSIIGCERDFLKRNMPADILGFAYAVTVAAGGILGYVKAGSVPSLVAGLLFGSLAGLGAYQTSQDPNNVKVLLGTSAVLMGVMGQRFYRSSKFMPAGLVTTLSLLMVIKCAYKILSKA